MTFRINPEFDRHGGQSAFSVSKRYSVKRPKETLLHYRKSFSEISAKCAFLFSSQILCIGDKNVCKP